MELQLNLKKIKAFTLTEVLVTVIVLSVGIVGLLHGYKQLVNALDVTRKYQDSVCLLKNKLVDVELYGVGDDGVKLTGDFEGEFKDFSWRIDRISAVTDLFEQSRFVVFNKKDLEKREFSILTYVRKKE